MKEVKLTEKDYRYVKSEAVKEWIEYNGSKEYAITASVINSFIMYCSSKNYIIKDGKVLLKDEEK